MSPEYAMEGLFSVRSDVYSFGILILEIITGQKNSSFHNMEGSLNIVGYVSSSLPLVLISNASALFCSSSSLMRQSDLCG